MGSSIWAEKIFALFNVDNKELNYCVMRQIANIIIEFRIINVGNLGKDHK